MGDASSQLQQRAPTFFALTRAAFRFLEERFGYRLENEAVEGLDDWRDVRANVRYLGERVAVTVEWSYADGYIVVTFAELRSPWVRPAHTDPLGTNAGMPLRVDLDTLAMMAGQADDPDFLLHGHSAMGRRSFSECHQVIDRNLPGVIEGLARATQRYAANIVAGDTSRLPEIVRFYAQEHQRLYRR